MFTSPYSSATSLPMWPQNQQQHQQYQSIQNQQQPIPMGNGISSSVGGPYRVAAPPNHHHQHYSSSAASAPQARMDLGSFSSVFSSQAQLPAPQQMQFPQRVGGGHHPNDGSVGTMYPSSVRVEIDSSGTVGYADASHELGPWAPKEIPSPNPPVGQPFRRIIHDHSTPDCSHELAELSHLPTPISSSERSASISMFAVQHSIPDQMVLSSQGSQSLPQLPYPTLQPITGMSGSSGYHQGGNYSNSSNSMLLHHQPPPPPIPYSPGPMPMGASAANMHPSTGGFYIGQPHPNHYATAGGPFGNNGSIQNGNTPMYSTNGVLPYQQIHHHHQQQVHNPYQMQSQIIHMAPHGVIHPPLHRSSNMGGNPRNPTTIQMNAAQSSTARRVQPSALDHPEHSPLPPCAHNNWDNLRVKKSIMMLACRDCGSKWRRVFPPKDMCEPFHGPAQHCPVGRECPMLHVHRYKNRARPGESGDISGDIKRDVRTSIYAQGASTHTTSSTDGTNAPQKNATSTTSSCGSGDAAMVSAVSQPPINKRPSPPALTLQDSEGNSTIGAQKLPDVSSPLTPLHAAHNSHDDDDDVGSSSSPLLAGESLVRTSAHHLPPALEEHCQ